MSDRKRATGATIKQDATTGKWGFVLDAPPDPITGKRRQIRRRGLTKAEAKNELTKVLSAIREGTHVARDDQSLKTFLLEHWLPVHRRTITASTLSQYRRLIDTHVVPALGALKVQEIKPTHINAFYTDLLDHGRRDHGRTAANGDGLSPTTVVKVHALLHEAFDAAVEWDVIVRNPVAASKPPKARRRSKLNVWTDEECTRFLDSLEQHEDAYAAPLRLALTTGLRRGELLGLAWDDVDLEAHKLTVRAQLLVIDGAMVYSEDTKSHRARTVDLDDETAAVLRRYRVRQEAQCRWTAGYRDAQFKRSDGSDVHLVFRHAGRNADQPASVLDGVPTTRGPGGRTCDPLSRSTPHAHIEAGARRQAQGRARARRPQRREFHDAGLRDLVVDRASRRGSERSERHRRVEATQVKLRSGGTVARRSTPTRHRSDAVPPPAARRCPHLRRTGQRGATMYPDENDRAALGSVALSRHLVQRSRRWDGDGISCGARRVRLPRHELPRARHA